MPTPINLATAHNVISGPHMFPHLDKADVVAAASVDPAHASVYFTAARVLADSRLPAGEGMLHRRLGLRNSKGKQRVADTTVLAALAHAEIHNDFTTLADTIGNNPFIMEGMFTTMTPEEVRRFSGLLHMPHTTNPQARAAVQSWFSDQKSRARKTHLAKTPHQKTNSIETLRNLVAVTAVAATALSVGLYVAGNAAPLTAAITAFITVDIARRLLRNTRKPGQFRMSTILSDYGSLVATSLWRTGKAGVNMRRKRQNTPAHLHNRPVRAAVTARRDGTKIATGDYTY